MDAKTMQLLVEERFPKEFRIRNNGLVWLCYNGSTGCVFFSATRSLGFRFQNKALLGMFDNGSRYTPEIAVAQLLKNQTITEQAAREGVRIIDVPATMDPIMFRLLLSSLDEQKLEPVLKANPESEPVLKVNPESEPVLKVNPEVEEKLENVEVIFKENLLEVRPEQKQEKGGFLDNYLLPKLEQLSDWIVIPKEPKKEFLHEKECRRILEELYPGKSFASAKNLEWLKNPKTNKYLELDCYNAELELALEYQGKQHYQIGKFSETPEKLKAQQARDLHKLKACFKNNVRLIIVPYTIDFCDLKAYIQLQLR